MGQTQQQIDQYLAMWIEKIDSAICCLQETHLRNMNRLRVKRKKNNLLNELRVISCHSLTDI